MKKWGYFLFLGLVVLNSLSSMEQENADPETSVVIVRKKRKHSDVTYRKAWLELLGKAVSNLRHSRDHSEVTDAWVDFAFSGESSPIGSPSPREFTDEEIDLLNTHIERNSPPPTPTGRQTE